MKQKVVSLTADILGLNEDLIARRKVLLQAMSSGFDIDTEKFRLYCLYLANLYMKLYGWYPMPTSIHVILIHGYAIIKASSLPIGKLSEDAQEARNKDIRRNRENFSRKFARKKIMEGVFHRLLASSYPLILSLQNYEPKVSKPLPQADMELLVEQQCITFDDSE